MHEEKPTGNIDPRQESSLERQFERAKSSYMPSIVRHEDDGSKTDMILVERSEIDSLRQRVSDLKHALGEDAGWFDRAKNAEQETLRLLAEIEAWKDASGLERGGDPDAVTPDDLRNEIANLHACQEKSWGAADEALLAEHEAEMAKVCLVVEQFCRQCEYRPDPGSCSDCPLQPYGGGK